MSAPHTKRIAELNDQLRSRLGLPLFGMMVPGTVLMTQGISALPIEVISIIIERVRNHSDFGPNSDPYGEHDFGSLDIESTGTIFWKIEYFADQRCKWGSENPSDPSRSYRVLTIMLAEDY